jgi:hypothetical protein
VDAGEAADAAFARFFAAAAPSRRYCGGGKAGMVRAARADEAAEEREQGRGMGRRKVGSLTSVKTARKMQHSGAS